MASYSELLSVAKPIPAHALTPEAESAREAVRRFGWERRLDRDVASLVTKRGNSKRVAYEGVRITAAALSLARLAEAAGFDVIVRDTRVGCVVEGLHVERRVGFRAYWERGASTGATWHSGGRDRWKLTDISERPIGFDARTRTTKARHRHDEDDRYRLALVESPRGVHCSVTELRKRINA